MGWRILADTVLVAHLAFVIFVVAGGFMALRWRKLAWVHLPVAVYGAALELIGFGCPLTPLEKNLRVSAGQAGYDGGFVEHYIVELLYPGKFTLGERVALSVIVIGTAVIAYALYFGRHRQSGQLRVR